MTHSGEYERIVAQTYDSVYAKVRDPSGDIAFYVEQAKRYGGPVLELGCGTGRILLPIARAGIACVGLDASNEMLRRFREKHPPDNVELVHEKMEDFELGERRFRLITAPFRALQHLLDVPAQLAALENIRRHLAPGGSFVFDVFDPKLERTALVHEPEREGVAFTHNGKPMRRFETVSRDLTTQVMTVSLRFEGEGPTGETALRIRWYYRYEVEHLLARAGFSKLAFYGGFAQRPWQSGRDMVVVAQAE